MKAWSIDSYGDIDSLKFIEKPDPLPKKGWVLIQIKAFGINRSELYTRQGHSGDSVTIPRVLGIECVGLVLDNGSTDLKVGQKVAAAMGGMGRLHDGGYADITLIPRANVFPVDTDLPWPIFGAIPETYLTAWGAIRATRLKPDSSILIRGGTSSVGLACASIAKDLNCKVISTTRSKEKFTYLKKTGVDSCIIDDGNISSRIKEYTKDGVNAVVELVGIKKTILDSLQGTAPFGTVCMVGFLGDSWNYNFFPWMPSTVNLTLYSSETLLNAEATRDLQFIADKVAQGSYKPNIYKTFSFDELPKAQLMMEESKASGKLVVAVD